MKRRGAEEAVPLRRTSTSDGRAGRLHRRLHRVRADPRRRCCRSWRKAGTSFDPPRTSRRAGPRLAEEREGDAAAATAAADADRPGLADAAADRAGSARGAGRAGASAGAGARDRRRRRRVSARRDRRDQCP
ncbi:MAG: hypothetical protein MZW92_49745 [Comamonadaceae bacterium]|nr:hypothetical protein [Comamonadaceae bacterium]